MSTRNMNNSALKLLVCVILMFFRVPAFSSEWGVIGAGNATCKNWSRSDPELKKEITSWMQGFATSESLSRAAACNREFRLELLTNEYLNNQINTVCSSERGAKTSMSGIIIDVLTKFPVH